MIEGRSRGNQYFKELLVGVPKKAWTWDVSRYIKGGYGIRTRKVRVKDDSE